MKRKLIVLLSDFGITDNYVGIMKGIIYSIAPEAKIMDLTHDIKPQNIKQAAFILSNSVDYFTKETIFLSVIDPEVGSEQKAIAMKTGNFFFIAPNNGILSYISDKYPIESTISLTNQKYHLKNISSTFHGRDIFAPVAAHLAAGININEFGEKINHNEIVKLPPLICHIDEKGAVHGEIIYADHFGNLITSINSHIIKKLFNPIIEFKRKVKIVIGNNEIHCAICNSYYEVSNSETLAYIGSSGFLEIGIRDGNAKKKIGIDIDVSSKIEVVAVSY